MAGLMGQGSGPIVVGGVSGSGTRLVAEMLIRLGYFMGDDLNEARDNLWATFLFKRKEWLATHSKQPAAIFKVCRVLEKCLERRDRLDTADVIEIMKASADWIAGSAGRFPFRKKAGLDVWLRRKVIAARMVVSMIRAGYCRHNLPYAGWGWKEPNSYIFLPYYSDYFKHLRYIHVIRHGLDMAYSRKKSQLYRWGDLLFGMKPPRWEEDVPSAMLSYWVQANERAIEWGQKLGGRFLLLSYDNLCRSPEGEIEKLIAFLGLEREKTPWEALLALPQRHPSVGRHKVFGVGRFRPGDLEAVRRFGFTLDEAVS